MQRYSDNGIFSIIITIFTSMNMVTYHVMGVMSGTSLDGIDLCYIRFDKNYKWKFDILAAETVAYNHDWLRSLKLAIHLPINELDALDVDYSKFLATTIKSFIDKHDINKLDAICSHGHTVFHQPEQGITKQIGNLPMLSILLEHRVVCDFRVEDVALGGQGAPLVPIGDRLLFDAFDYCLNLGGFANISFEQNEQRIAFDICPVNIVLNHYASQKGFSFDNEGQLASQGSIHEELLMRLNRLDYYKKDFPKSLGLEWVQEKVFPIIDSFQLDIEDVLATYVEHVVIQISAILNRYFGQSTLISGGGAYNTFLIKKLKKRSNCKIHIMDKTTTDFKEALIFGLLGVLKLRHEVNCLRSVTGAKYDHSSGKVFEP